MRKKELYLSLKKTFIKATELENKTQENASVDERDNHLYHCLAGATISTYISIIGRDLIAYITAVKIITIKYIPSFKESSYICPLWTRLRRPDIIHMQNL